MGEAYSGYDGEVHSGAHDNQVQGWTLDYEIGTFDSSVTADGGWEDTGGALKKISGSFDAFYRVSPNNPTGSASGITTGSKPTLTFYIDKLDLPNEFFTGVGLITKLSFKSKVKDGSIYTASFTSKGVWTVPS